MRFELTSFAWKAKNLPLIYIRIVLDSLNKKSKRKSKIIKNNFQEFLIFLVQERIEKPLFKKNRGTFQ